MEQPEQYQLIQMVNQTMVFIARCFLIPIQPRFLDLTNAEPDARNTILIS
jgi:hypothetical protein